MTAAVSATAAGGSLPAGNSANAPAGARGVPRRRRRNTLLLFVLAAFILIPVRQGRSASSGDVARGEELFHAHCSVCHGEGAVGQDTESPAGGWDKDNRRLAPALNGSGHAWHHSPTLIFEYMKEGSIDETSPMPSFGDVLSDSEIHSIIAYIFSLWPDEIMRNYRERFGSEMR